MKTRFLISSALSLLLIFGATPLASAASNNNHKNVGGPRAEAKMEKKGPKQKAPKPAKPKETEVQSISLNKTETTIQVGSWERLAATVSPNKAQQKHVYWTTSNPAVAKVNPSGKVTGMNPGEAIIYATAYDGKQASCKVTIVARSADTTNPGEDDSDDIAVESVSIVQTTSVIALKEGTTKRLEAVVKPDDATDKSVTWSSNNTRVAKVDQSGKVTALSEGAAVITVTTNDGSKTDTCTVRVIEAEDWVKADEIELNLVNTTIVEGTDETLKYRLGPDDVSDETVTWTTSNSNVASVDIYGTVHAKNPGTAVITAKTADGRETDSCLVTVVPRPTATPGSISFNKISSTLIEDAKDYPIVYGYPDNINISSLTWSSSDTSIATVSQTGVVTAVSTGTCVIKVETSDQTATYVLIVTED